MGGVRLTLALCLAAAGVWATPVSAETESQEFDYKLTVAAYRAGERTSCDANLRRKLDDFVVWVGAYADPRGDSQSRAGGEYDLARREVLVVPSLQTASNGFVQGSVYAELGGPIHAILGYSRTNLKPYFTLTFDPNDSAQLGVGRTTTAGGRIDLFTIADVRLGTGQQDTHLLWRRRVAARDRITLDVVYKSGHTDDGGYARAVGATATFDFPRWSVRAAYDPYVNFSRDTMVRLGIGWRF